MSFELNLRISPSEKDFFLKFGPDWTSVKNKIHIETLRKDDYCCQGCGYRSLDHNNAQKILQPHLVKEDEQDLLNSEFISLCKACHTTQHIDKAVSEGWVNIVNSSFSQKSLIEMCRISSVVKYISDGDIRILKTTPEEYINQLHDDLLPLHSRVKIIFTNKFEWGDL
jgi:hypothetical protein